MAKSLHSGHRSRVRERFLHVGLDTFEPHEVLELLLFEFIPVVNTNPLGHILIDRFGSVRRVLTATYDELIAVPGIGTKTAEGILGIFTYISNDICKWFCNSGPLTRYDIAFIADWFLGLTPSGSIGIIICGADHVFHDFVHLRVNDEDMLYRFAKQIVDVAHGQSYYLLIKDDFTFLSEEKIMCLRIMTGRVRTHMLDTFVFDGYHPVSLLHRDR